LDALKRIEKIIGGNSLEQKKKKPGSKFNPGLALIGLRTTGPESVNIYRDEKNRKAHLLTNMNQRGNVCNSHEDLRSEQGN